MFIFKIKCDTFQVAKEISKQKNLQTSSLDSDDTTAAGEALRVEEYGIVYGCVVVSRNMV